MPVHLGHVAGEAGKGGGDGVELHLKRDGRTLGLLVHHVVRPVQPQLDRLSAPHNTQQSGSKHTRTRTRTTAHAPQPRSAAPMQGQAPHLSLAVGVDLLVDGQQVRSEAVRTRSTDEAEGRMSAVQVGRAGCREDWGGGNLSREEQMKAWSLLALCTRTLKSRASATTWSYAERGSGEGSRLIGACTTSPAFPTREHQQIE